ncbi:MAG: hypothetical protein A2806_04090 [Candidatus Terrybacteria bacterium RIFCSPHIGHO2_01_FULL_48_17]|uniref:Translation elongation factor-like protein n=1 Tax=Candidatus Terrybacteria bacterium RIFCSPHIGHO2_01_FULL_48_17 TaxID=1802362 RepID=A0A1G2PKK3_9BACT|nr:MAG: hypothetical protein A2806_04090 [Candidatus Terrybacteria bacterium RIFCSPHIGHO2_01_FULL_48_17]OHA53745.1 MAG: hypothetical protein A3A30_05245 [Candidatus Terrybacteria bacterium RIFCSPLOWO2_01_FULL_48_14]
MNTNTGELVGAITHYYPKINVAVVKLSAPLRVGDNIQVVTKGGEFTQAVSSMQVDHKSVNQGNAGEVIAIMVEQKVREGDEVRKVQ